MSRLPYVINTIQSNGNKYIVKQWIKDQSPAMMQWRAETGYNFSHPNIAKLLGSNPAKGQYTFEHYPYTLQNLIDCNALSDDTVLKFIIDIGNGLAHLHQCGIICHNIYARDIVIEAKSDGTHVARIGDWRSGIYKQLLESDKQKSFRYDISSDTGYFAKLIIYLQSFYPGLQFLLPLCKSVSDTVANRDDYTRLTLYDFLAELHKLMPAQHLYRVIVPAPVTLASNLLRYSTEIGDVYFSTDRNTHVIRTWGLCPVGTTVYVYASLLNNGITYTIYRKKVFVSTYVELVFELYKPIGSFTFTNNSITGKVCIMFGSNNYRDICLI